ncbi:MAG: DUF4230 domain-containing protein [Saprospiraceae bacterium]|nr:DUF4230 domain-containing protein [Saprospiraceae bacterium]
MKRYGFIALILLACFGAGIWMANYWRNQKEVSISRSQSTVLLEQVRKVCKLVTVEGTFTELYNDTNIRKMTLYLPLPTTWNFSKTALLEVKGKVLVGYDLENIKITTDSINRIVRISNLPKPEILSVDHEVKFTNMDESFFNGFTKDDYTRLAQNAKTMLREKAVETKLLEEAAEQGNQLFDVMKFMVEGAGWRLEVEGATPAPGGPDSLAN